MSDESGSAVSHGDNSDGDDGEQSGNCERGSSQEWGPDHPCFNGHLLLRDYTVLGRCDRCGKEIAEPTPRWILEAMDHHYKDDPRVQEAGSIPASDSERLDQRGEQA